MTETGTLFLVGTPIGNLGDMTDRGRETLAAVDVVAAEDTRRTGRLLARFGIKARQVSLHEGNERARTEKVLALLRRGLDVAVVSDAGMPGVSDPGFRLVRACAQEGIDVRVVPGPSAAVAALVVSGLPTDRFVFEGFLPRELNKMHEEVIRGRITEVLAEVEEREPRGEMVLVVEGASQQPSGDSRAAAREAVELVESGVRPRAAAADAARKHGVSANEVYRSLIERR